MTNAELKELLEEVQDKLSHIDTNELRAVGLHELADMVDTPFYYINKLFADYTFEDEEEEED